MFGHPTWNLNNNGDDLFANSSKAAKVYSEGTLKGVFIGGV